MGSALHIVARVATPSCRDRLRKLR